MGCIFVGGDNTNNDKNGVMTVFDFEELNLELRPNDSDAIDILQRTNWQTGLFGGHDKGEETFLFINERYKLEVITISEVEVRRH